MKSLIVVIVSIFFLSCNSFKSQPFTEEYIIANGRIEFPEPNGKPDTIPNGDELIEDFYSNEEAGLRIGRLRTTKDTSLVGFMINRKFLDVILRDTSNKSVLIYFARHPNNADNTKRKYTIVYGGTQAQTVNELKSTQNFFPKTFYDHVPPIGR